MKNSSYDLKISEWIEDVTEAGCTVNDVKIIHEIHKKNGELLFALLDTDVRSAEGNKLPNIVFIRGHACLIVTQLRNKLTGEEKFLMIRQRRIGNGQMCLEFPAGMLDYQTKDPVGVAVREIEEETGLDVNRSDIFALAENMLYSSAGGSDEGIYFYGCIKELDDLAYKSFESRMTGNAEEHEYITTVLISREEAMPCTTSAQAMLGFFLFDSATKKK